MNRKGPILLIDDDPDDKELFSLAYAELGYQIPLIFLQSGQEAIEFLIESFKDPFLILCDINMPKKSGFDVRKEIAAHATLANRAVPFIYFSTSDTKEMVTKAYATGGHGYFVKDNTLKDLKETVDAIMKYWLRCKSPNNYAI